MIDFEQRQVDLAKEKPDSEFTRDAIGAIREVDTDSGTAVFDISTKSLDLHRSCVNTDGIDYQSRYYGKNPIVLFNHDYDRPIARSEWVRKMENGALRAKCSYGKTNLAQEVLSLVKDGIINSASIGFMSKEQYFDVEAAKAYKEDYGEDAPEGMNWYIRKSVLLEWSNVSVGSNGDALAARMGSMSPQLRSMVVAEYVREEMPKMYQRLNDLVAQLATSVEANGALSQNVKILENKISELESEIRAGAVQPKKVEPVGNGIRVTNQDLERMIANAVQNKFNYLKGQV